MLLISSNLQAMTFTVINTNDSGAGSLRDAIDDSNANPPISAQANIIEFNIPGTGPFVIKIGTLNINVPVVIDGYTQPEAQPATATSPAVLQIILQPQNAPAHISLNIGSDGSTIRGLVMNSFTGFVMEVLSSGNKIVGNYIGTDVSGGSAQPNGIGIVVQSKNNMIGTKNPADRNIISGNKTGINILGGSNNSIVGNYIGTDATGSKPIPNNIGIIIDSQSTNNFIEQNIISFNNTQAILLQNGSTNNNIFCNKMSNNGSYGVQIDGSTSVGNQILGNSIFDNVLSGIFLSNGGNDNQPAPVITSATTSCCTITVSGTFTARPNTQYTIEFFLNDINRASITEGKTSVGTIQVTTDSSGNVTFSDIRLLVSAPATKYISATATVVGSVPDTSAFSPNQKLVQGTRASALSVAVFSKYCAQKSSACAQLGLVDASVAPMCQIGNCTFQNNACTNCCANNICQNGTCVAATGNPSS